LWAERGKKVLIATPRRLILQSFTGQASWLWDQEGKVGTPEAVTHTYSKPLQGGVSEELTLREFLEHKRDPDHPIFVGTHQGVLAALRDVKERGVPIDDLVVIIDEVHQLSVENKLGTVLKELIARNVPTLLMTGTPFRGDGKPILPSELMDLYQDHTYHRDYAESLDEAEYLQGFSCEVLVGDIRDTLSHVLEKVEEEDRYVVIKLPYVNSQHNRRLAKGLGLDPQNMSAAELKAEAEGLVIEMCDKYNLSYISIVEEGRVREEFEKILDTTRDIPATETEPAKLGSPELLPRVVISQDTVSLGVDCPWWTDSVMLGVTSSCVQTIQFGQRCGRDHRSKTQRPVKSWSLVPNYWEPEVTSDGVREFMLQLIKTKLWLNFVGEPVKPPQLNTTGSAALHHGHSPVPNDRVPPSPDAVSDNDLAVMQQLLNGLSHAEGRLTLHQLISGPTVTVVDPDDGHHTVLGDGNHMPKMDVVTMSDEQVIPVLRDLLLGMERTICKGEAAEAVRVFKRYASTWDLVKGLWDNGERDLAVIHRHTGWEVARIEVHLIEHGLLPKKRAKQPRQRGQKSD